MDNRTVAVVAVAVIAASAALFFAAMLSPQNVLLADSGSAADSSPGAVLAWRSVCERYSPEPWKESFNDNRKMRLCLTNSSVYFEVEAGRNSEGALFRATYADAYINGIGFDNGAPLAEGARVEFMYNFPFFEDDPSACPDKAEPELYGQHIFISNFDNETFGTSDFLAARYTLAPEEKACGRWLLFNHSVADFVPESGSFSPDSRRIGAIDFEFANVYVRNITIVGKDGSTVKVW